MNTNNIPPNAACIEYGMMRQPSATLTVFCGYRFYPLLEEVPFNVLQCCICHKFVVDHDEPCCPVCESSYPRDICCGSTKTPGNCNKCGRLKFDVFCCFEEKMFTYFALQYASN